MFVISACLSDGMCIVKSSLIFRVLQIYSALGCLSASEPAALALGPAKGGRVGGQTMTLIGNPSQCALCITCTVPGHADGWTHCRGMYEIKRPLIEHNGMQTENKDHRFKR